MERKVENIQKVIIQELTTIMSEDKNVFAVNADLGLLFKDGVPEGDWQKQLFDVGIAEQNMIGLASGLAYSGKTVFTTTIAEMAVARVVEQIRLDACYPNLNINMFGQGRGFAYGMGGNSHIILEDIAILRAIPNMTIILPADATEARKVIRAAVKQPGPKYIAISRGMTPTIYEEDYEFEVGKAVQMRAGKDLTLIATGDMVVNCLDAAQILETRGMQARVLNMHTVKPLDEEAVIRAAKETGAVITVESHSILGGLGGAVAEVLMENCLVPMKRLGAPDQFSPVGSNEELIRYAGLDPTDIVEAATQLLKNSR